QQWVNLLQSGQTLETVQAYFIAAPEFLAHNDSDYVQSLYRLVLGRTGGPAELASWYTVLQQPGGLQTVATQFARSLENRQNAAASACLTFLHRTPTPAERDALANATGLDLLGIQLAVLNLPEFLTNG